MPSLLHAMTEDNPDCRLEFCEWIQRKAGDDAWSLGLIVQTDEATFNLNGTVNWHIVCTALKIQMFMLTRL
jgi:hypothetical protein